MIYKIECRLTNSVNGWRTSTQVPTFFLDSDVQAIESAEHACRIARKVVDPFGLFKVYVNAGDTDGNDFHHAEF